LHLTGRAKLTSKQTVLKVVRLLFLFALPLAICSPGSAASLQGKVAEIIDGENITVVSVNHLVKVRVIAIATPDKGQAYSDVAKQHLADLILNKYVVVQYSLLRDGYLVGQVMNGDMDVGAQMIRDGVAWYDKSDERHLTEAEQRIYAASQDAARSERRGLWQDASPVSPWDFRKAQAAAQVSSTYRSPQSVARERAHLTRGSAAGLSSEDLMGLMGGAGSLAARPEARRISSDDTPGHWMTYQRSDGRFSVLIPTNAYEVTTPVVDEQGKTANISFLAGHHSNTLYLVICAKGPDGRHTDASIADEAIKNLLAGMNSSTQKFGIVMTANPGRSLTVSGYTGKQFSISGGQATGVVRVLSKETAGEREMFLLFALSPNGDPLDKEFLNSLKIDSNPSK
jgi:endonuclease YncB( thermonuclease family)